MSGRSDAGERPELPAQIALIGNAGAGKTTLARRLARAADRPLLSLDDVVWDPDRPRLMRAPSRQHRAVAQWIAEHPAWVVEGAYADLVERAFATAGPGDRALIWLTPSPAVCAARVRARSAPMHGFADEAARDARVRYIADWALTYGDRTDRTSEAAHRALAEGFDGAVWEGEAATVEGVVAWLEGR